MGNEGKQARNSGKWAKMRQKGVFLASFGVRSVVLWTAGEREG
jgi:hypothetical protein